MPLAGDVRVVAGVFQQLGDGQRAIVEEPLVAREPFALVVGRAHRAFTDQVMIRARDQHRAGDGADRARVVIGQDAPVGDQIVQVGRVDLTAQRVDVGIAEIIGHDVQDVGLTHVPLSRAHGARILTLQGSL